MAFSNHESRITNHGFLIAAPASGQGKTSVALALMAALKRRGLEVAPFKVGPDFIDPGHHGRICGRPSHNLDGWMCGEQAMREIFARGCDGADIAIVEGVMGLFDGAGGDTDQGSSAEIARCLDIPVLLVVDSARQARSAAALVKGFVEFDPRLRFAGVIFNRVGSGRHEELLRQAVASTPGLPPVLGCLPRREELALPERHLGLVTDADRPLDEAFQGRLAGWLEDSVDLDSLLGGKSPHPQPLSHGERVAGGRVRGTVRIGVARDEAFCFYYPENLELLEAAGAELAFFSPLRDARLPKDIAGLYLGGGYPELHAERLSGNRPLLEEIRRRAEDGLPVYAECGGFVYLSRGIVGAGLVPARSGLVPARSGLVPARSGLVPARSGLVPARSGLVPARSGLVPARSGRPQGAPLRKFVGCFPAVARMLPRRRALGYRQATFTADTPLGPAGTVVRGHEFHYSEMEIPGDAGTSYRLSRRGGEDLGVEGYRVGNVLGSYVHLHFGSNPQVADNFVEFCRSLARSREEGEEVQNRDS